MACTLKHDELHLTQCQTHTAPPPPPPQCTVLVWVCLRVSMLCWTRPRALSLFAGWPQKYCGVIPGHLAQTFGKSNGLQACWFVPVNCISMGSPQAIECSAHHTYQVSREKCPLPDTILVHQHRMDVHCTLHSLLQ